MPRPHIPTHLALIDASAPARRSVVPDLLDDFVEALLAYAEHDLRAYHGDRAFAPPTIERLTVGALETQQQPETTDLRTEKRSPHDATTPCDTAVVGWQDSLDATLADQIVAKLAPGTRVYGMACTANRLSKPERSLNRAGLGDYPGSSDHTASDDHAGPNNCTVPVNPSSRPTPNALAAPLKHAVQTRSLPWMGCLEIGETEAVRDTLRLSRMSIARRPVSEGIDELIAAVRSGLDAGRIVVRPSIPCRLHRAIVAHAHRTNRS